MARLGLLALLGLVTSLRLEAAEQPPPLAVEARIPLGEVAGRIDHFAIDLPRQRTVCRRARQ